jgi:acyl carrier protein/predicted N-acetyltransferase YhbS
VDALSGLTPSGSDAGTVRQAVVDTLRRIAPQSAPAELSPTTPLRDQLDLDSMDWLNFLVELREKLGVDIPEADYAKLVTLDDLLAYIEQHRAAIPPNPPQLVGEHRLLDGRIVTIRPIRPDDADRVRDFLTASSEESRYKRFHKWIHMPSNKLVHFLTDIDHDRCLALVCAAHQGPDEEIVGEARCVANPDAKSCEFGLLIEDSWRRTGIAGLLMEALIHAARDRGFAAIEGIVLASNPAMLQFANALGFTIEPMTDDRTTLRIHRRLQPLSAPISAA